jgi:adenylate cyclase
LGRNSLREFPNQLHRCTALETLDLSGNKLSVLCVRIKLPCLTELIASHNNIGSFDVSGVAGGFSQAFPVITCLDISDNPINHIPQFGSTTTLEIVNMLHCGISQLTAKQQREMAAIRLVYMQGNPLETTSRRVLRTSYVEHRTDLIISDLSMRHKFRNGSTSPTSGSPEMLGVAWSEIKGGRSTQEDTMSISQRKEDSEHMFGVFDGHRGSEVSRHCAVKFPHFLKHTIQQFPNNSGLAMREAFVQMSASIAKEGLTAGSTAAVTLVQPRTITLGHVGDARAVLYTVFSPNNPRSPQNQLRQYTKTIMHLANSKVVAIATMDHTAKNKVERQRVERELGGYVSEQGRIMGDIAVTRALGDGQFSPFITNEPSVLVVSRTGEELFMVVACDGLWDVVTVERAYHLITAYLMDASQDPSQVALMLRDHAFSLGSTDNISVIIVNGLGVSSPRARTELNSSYTFHGC